MTYDEAVAWIQTMLEIPANQEDSNFTRILPAMFLYAEGRIYRELTFLVTTITQQKRLTARAREFALPDSVLVLDTICVCTPAGPITDSSKRSPPLERISPAALDMFWPQATFKPGVPKKYALVGSTPQAMLQVAPLAQPPPPIPPLPQSLTYAVRLMPSPDQAYTVELTGTILPEPLSSHNQETFLSTRYPELLLCACMVFGSGYQRDFGAQAEDPQKAVSWEAQYNGLRQGIMLETARMRGEGPGFTSLPPAQIGQQPRAP